MHWIIAEGIHSTLVYTLVYRAPREKKSEALLGEECSP